MLIKFSRNNNNSSSNTQKLQSAPDEKKMLLFRGQRKAPADGQIQASGRLHWRCRAPSCRQPQLISIQAEESSVSHRGEKRPLCPLQRGRVWEAFENERSTRQFEQTTSAAIKSLLMLHQQQGRCEGFCWKQGRASLTAPTKQNTLSKHSSLTFPIFFPTLY